MPRSGSPAPAIGHRRSRAARRLRRTAIVTIALGCLLATTTGVVLAQGGASGSQAIGSASALVVAGAEQQVVACKISVPIHALTAQGLATPWVLSGDRGGDCAETSPDQAAFVDATIFDPATGQVLIYRPLVITNGTTPAVAPVPPKLPSGAVVEISVGFNGDELTLTDADGGRDIAESHCVNGQLGSIFGQEIFCNAPAFYAAANGNVSFSPPLGTSPDDHQQCPTTESWEIVDQDQSDNTTTNYLVQGDRTAQRTAANQQALGGDQIGNGSDNALYTKFYAPAIHCQPPQATDVTDPAAPVRSTSSALLNLFARAAGNPEPALVPMGDPFTLVDGKPNLEKTNLYRAQVDQPAAAQASDASTAAYCRNLLDQGLSKIELDRSLLQAFGTSPDPAVSNDLHLFVLNRFKETWDNLGCQDATGIPNPVTVTTDANGQVLSARVTTTTSTTEAPTATAGAPTTTTAGAPTTTAGAPTTTAGAPTTTDAGAATTTAAGAPTTTARAPTTTAGAPTTAAGGATTTSAGAQMVTASSTGGSPTTTTPPRQTQAAVPGLAERHPPATNASATVNAAPARSGIGQGLLPFTGLDSRALLLVAAMLMGVGGWLLVWASRVKHAQPARYR
jgi:hypothetical protein